ncbi:DUF4114 domain-containing protein [Nitrosomonas marina]|uniref:PEP-CTERM protein-sorting domain-containing protein n=1 Tax=Nitrosomonas marina TaxID=917 RepID=A0A1H8GVS9_9PROT|nr:DUF4114 domain-containing protein [Nitrosomonas marina]SEN48241.1 PEP-CTERM protein-sorting domain-containing protein [Nitrosomonas marina]
MKKQYGTAFKTTMAAAISLVAAGSAHATVTFGDGGASLQGILNDITVAPINNVSSTNVNTDQILLDEYWQISGSGGSFAQIIIELAGNANTNTVGIYDASDPSKQVTLFSGIEGAGAQKLLSFANDGSVIINFADTGIDFSGNAFGYFLNTGGNIFYSDTDLNNDGIDHMVAFQGQGTDTIDLPATLPGIWSTNEYIMAWEDIYGGGDTDYNDFVLITESVNPIPEPSMLALFGIGLIGFIRRRNEQAG